MDGLGGRTAGALIRLAAKRMRACTKKTPPPTAPQSTATTGAKPPSQTHPPPLPPRHRCHRRPTSRRPRASARASATARRTRSSSTRPRRSRAAALCRGRSRRAAPPRCRRTTSGPTRGGDGREVAVTLCCFFAMWVCVTRWLRSKAAARIGWCAPASASKAEPRHRVTRVRRRAAAGWAQTPWTLQAREFNPHSVSASALHLLVTDIYARSRSFAAVQIERVTRKIVSRSIPPDPAAMPGKQPTLPAKAKAKKAAGAGEALPKFIECDG